MVDGTFYKARPSAPKKCQACADGTKPCQRAPPPSPPPLLLGDGDSDEKSTNTAPPLPPGPPGNSFETQCCCFCSPARSPCDKCRLGTGTCCPPVNRCAGCRAYQKQHRGKMQAVTVLGQVQCRNRDGKWRLVENVADNPGTEGRDGWILKTKQVKRAKPKQTATTTALVDSSAENEQGDDEENHERKRPRGGQPPPVAAAPVPARTPTPTPATALVPAGPTVTALVPAAPVPATAVATPATPQSLHSAARQEAALVQLQRQLRLPLRRLPSPVAATTTTTTTAATGPTPPATIHVAPEVALPEWHNSSDDDDDEQKERKKARKEKDTQDREQKRK